MSETRRSTISVIVASLAMWCGLAAYINYLGTSDHGLFVQYFKGTKFEKPVGSGIDRNLAFVWEIPPLPEMGPGAFALRWFGRILAPESGEYEISAITNGGLTLSIDGEKVLESSGLCGERKIDGRVNLTDGAHRILIKFVDTAPPLTRIRILWKPPSASSAVTIPPSALRAY